MKGATITSDPWGPVVIKTSDFYATFQEPNRVS